MNKYKDYKDFYEEAAVNVSKTNGKVTTKVITDPKKNDWSTALEDGVAQSIFVNQPDIAMKHLKDKDVVVLSTSQLEATGKLGKEMGKRLQLAGVDILVMSKDDFYSVDLNDEEQAISCVMERCVKIQVKTQPFAHRWKTVNVEMYDHYINRETQETTIHPYKDISDVTAYIVSAKVVILLDTKDLKELAHKANNTKPIGEARHLKTGIYSTKQTYCSRLSTKDLINLGTVVELMGRWVTFFKSVKKNPNSKSYLEHAQVWNKETYLSVMEPDGAFYLEDNQLIGEL